MPVRTGRLTATLVLACMLLPGVAHGAEGSLAAERMRTLKALQRQLLLNEPSEKLERFREWHRRAAQPGNRIRRRPRTPAGDLGWSPERRGLGRPSSPASLGISTPVNTMVNDTTGENPDFGICQSEVSVASYGNYVVAAWNDGFGFEDIPYTSTQGFGYSSDGGLTWVDGGAPPGLNVGRWDSDPVVAVDERTGRFYFSALCDVADGVGGIGVVSGSFCGSTFSWGTPTLAVSVNTTTALVDKDWMAVDSLTGSVYVTYTSFGVSRGQIVPDQIEIKCVRSTDGGLTWAAPQVLSSPVDAGLVQGSRPAVGPDGEVYVVWSAIGQSEGPKLNSRFGRDFMRIRKSTDGGVSFGPEATVDSVFSNFGSGAPGFDRGAGITYPSIAVDRSSGPHRGRVYVGWNESLDFYDDPLPNPLDPAVALSEVEFNDSPPTANPFTPGQVLRGNRSRRGNPGDWDYYSFTGTQGQTIICYLDSIDVRLDAALRIFCTDGNTRLALSQNDFGGRELVVCTLPADATYYVRVASYQGAGLGGYRVLTALDSRGGDERARDHRDIFITSSDDGLHWGPTVRVNDSPGYFDDWLPEVAVDGSGHVFEAHYDYRDAVSACGGAASVYLARSDDGGATWSPEAPVTDRPTNWTLVYSSLIPAQGDYIGLCAREGTPLVAWGDGRDGDPNVYSSPAPLGCTNAPVTSVSTAGSTPEHMTVTWTAPAGFTATIIRRAGGVDTRLGLVTADALGQIVYVDTDVVPAETYAYRLETAGYCASVSCEVTAVLPCNAAPEALVEARSVPDSVVVTWKVAAGLNVTVERRDGDGDWAPVLPTTADAESTVVFVDLSIAAGHRYSYRLGVTGFCQQSVGEVSVIRPGFALYGFQPSPARPDVNVSFSLDAGGPASLALYDITGREVRRLEVGGLGPGPHVVNLTQGVSVRAGVYLVRLTQGSVSKARRVAVIR